MLLYRYKFCFVSAFILYLQLCFSKTSASKVDDMYNLLADLNFDAEHKPSSRISQKIDPIKSKIIKQMKSPVPVKNLGLNKKYSSILSFVDNSKIPGSKNIADVFSTINKVSSIYNHQKAMRQDDSNVTSSKVPSEEAGTLKTASKVINYLLEPQSVQKIMTISQKAHSEDEVLEELTNVILGAESRGGYGLKLDPITCIAIVTLATYLIRAVYQILLAWDTAQARHLDTDFNLLNVVDTAPLIVSNFYDTIAKATETYERLGIEKPSKNKMFKGFADAVKFVGLTSQQRESCIRKFICLRIFGKDYNNFQMVEWALSALGFYLDDFSVNENLWSAADWKNKETGCQKYSSTCSKNDQREENCQFCPLNDLEFYINQLDHLHN